MRRNFAVLLVTNHIFLLRTLYLVKNVSTPHATGMPFFV